MDRVIKNNNIHNLKFENAAQKNVRFDICTHVFDMYTYSDLRTNHHSNIVKSMQIPINTYNL